MLGEHAGLLLWLCAACALCAPIFLRERRRAAKAQEAAHADESAGDEGATAEPALSTGSEDLASTIDVLYRVVVLVVLATALAFVLPWAAVLRSDVGPGFAAMGVFLVPIAAAFVYAWSKGALEW